MKCIGKRDHAGAAKIINAVVNRMKKDGKWPPEKGKKSRQIKKAVPIKKFIVLQAQQVQ